MCLQSAASVVNLCIFSNSSNFAFENRDEKIGNTNKTDSDMKPIDFNKVCLMCAGMGVVSILAVVLDECKIKICLQKRSR